MMCCDGGVHLQVRSLPEFADMNGVWSIAFSPNGQLIISGGNVARIWDAATAYEVSGFVRVR